MFRPWKIDYLLQDGRWSAAPERSHSTLQTAITRAKTILRSCPEVYQRARITLDRTR